MKRVGNIYQSIISIENLMLADEKARKGKGYQYGIRVHDRNRKANIIALHEVLKNKTYRTSGYTTILIKDPKERLVYRLPYYPDRIVHHAGMNYLESIFVSTFTRDTYSCIKKRGIHAASRAVDEALQDRVATKYCLKLDIRKFYPNVDHDILKKLLRRKIKDQDLLCLLDEIIDSAPGVPIGNYLSQYFANFYLSYFDHWIKEVIGVKDYFRYADDIVIFGSTSKELHILLARIKSYLSEELKLEVKSNYQVFLVASYRGAPGRSVDFVGYQHYHEHKLLRNRIKVNCARKLARNPNPQTIAGYKGWMDGGHCGHLKKKLLHGNNRSGKAIQGLWNKAA